jgi:hypothetical protein
MRNTFGTTKASVGSSIVFDIFSQNRVGKDSDQGSANKGRDSLFSGAKGIEEIDTAKLPDTNPTELQFLTEYRSMKTACHELCHVFGMTHCPYFECLMNGSNLMNEADQKPFMLCPICLRKLETYLNLKDRLPERYKAMYSSIEAMENPMFNREKTKLA